MMMTALKVLSADEEKAHLQSGNNVEVRRQLLRGRQLHGRQRLEHVSLLARQLQRGRVRAAHLEAKGIGFGV